MENPNHELTDKSSEDSLKSIARVIEYPVIKDSFLIAGEYYNWIKGKSSTINSTLNWTENAVKDVVHRVEPIAASHLETLDKYACTKLDTLETKYPIVKEPSSEVLKTSSEYYEETIKPKVKGSVAYVASVPMMITTQTIEMLSSTANNFVGKYLGSVPPSGDAPDGTTTTTTTTTVDQEGHETTFRNAVKEIDVIRNYTMSNVQTLTSLLSSIYNKTITNNEEWMRRYYEEFRTEVDTNGSQAGTVDTTNSKLMHLAVHLSNKMRVSVRAMSTVCYNHLSPDYREKLDLVFAKTEQLYSNMSRSTLETLRDKVSMENVQWIGQAALGIMGVVKDSVVQKYKETTGKEVDCSETCTSTAATTDNKD